MRVSGSLFDLFFLVSGLRFLQLISGLHFVWQISKNEGGHGKILCVDGRTIECSLYMIVISKWFHYVCQPIEGSCLCNTR